MGTLIFDYLNSQLLVSVLLEYFVTVCSIKVVLYENQWALFIQVFGYDQSPTVL